MSWGYKTKRMRETHRPVFLPPAKPPRFVHYRDETNHITSTANPYKFTDFGVILTPFSNGQRILIPWPAVVRVEYSQSDQEMVDYFER